MEKEKLLQELEERLKGLPPEDRDKLIELYKDLIDVAEENRKNGNKSTLDIPSYPFDENFHIPINEEKKTYRNNGRMILATISLLLFNTIFVLGPAVAIAGIYFSMCLVSFSFVLSPFLAALKFIFGSFDSIEFFLTVILAGIGLMIGVGSVKVGKWLYRISMIYWNWNIKLIKGE
ncbi:HAAS domain-containing protein [Ferdinandcohnia quinoae]|uniref:DUF1700 domain-containing protein n=1 Tax=Fredinandcohnia quinoae TaxID=2918902 RepID=A0AAW5EC30_9BACI|nr:DUF1700 domain-containing protein [Fredinandcohnia sp. SECRCQ15]MCH1627537.1 DUF1700 domain-containing protein [Fredinandcohnia sp. SECRCQ15]